MKIAILTFHDTANYGAALQAYATIEHLRRAGHDVDILDYTNEHRRGIYQFGPRFHRQLRRGQLSGAGKTLLGAWAIRKRLAHFDAFYNAYTPRCSKHLTTSEELKDAAFEYDAVIAGSDQIWNPRNNGGDTSYLLDFVDDDDRTISYASSFGSIELNEQDRSSYARCLSRIRSLSVREKTGADLVKDLTGRSVPIVVDPVFLLSADDWTSLAQQAASDADVKTGILDYTAIPGMLEGFIRSTQIRKHIKQITRIGTSVRPKDLLLPNVKLAGAAGPLEFLSRLLRCELLFTSSFHGTALAILLRRPFITVLSGNPGRDSRITDLLSDVNLTERIYTPQMSVKDVLSPISFDAAQAQIEIRRNESIAFLDAAINSITPRAHV